MAVSRISEEGSFITTTFFFSPTTSSLTFHIFQKILCDLFGRESLWTISSWIFTFGIWRWQAYNSPLRNYVFSFLLFTYLLWFVSNYQSSGIKRGELRELLTFDACKIFILLLLFLKHFLMINDKYGLVRSLSFCFFVCLVEMKNSVEAIYIRIKVKY